MTVQSFDSFEEMQDALAAGVAAAQTRIQDFQRPMLDGRSHCWMRLVSYYGETLLICGQTADIEVQARQIAAKYPEECTEKEELAQYRQSLDRGFIAGQCYSVAEPSGEYGDTHVATVLEITPAQFMAFREASWDLAAIDPQGELGDIIRDWIKRVSYQ